MQQQNTSYKKLKCLFKGYAGKVYLIQWTSENDHPNKVQSVEVLKRYSRKPNDEQSYRDLNEYQILSQLSHQNILKINSAFDEHFKFKKCLCLTTDYMAPLNDLIPYLKQGHLNIFKQICFGLKYIHEQGLIHRDIKPSNIFIDENGIVKIGDFGITKKMTPVMTAQTCTKNYRPLELFFGKNDYDQSIDLWSLGCTLYELLTGKLLFNGFSELEIMSEIVNLLGNYDEQNFQGVTQLPNYFIISCDSAPKIDSLNVPYKGLIKQLLNYDSHQRPTIQMLLDQIPDEETEGLGNLVRKVKSDKLQKK